MPNYIDCPACGSETIMPKTLTEPHMRCPDCLQWIDINNNDKDAYALKKYYGSSLQLAGGYDDEYDVSDSDYNY